MAIRVGLYGGGERLIEKDLGGESSKGAEETQR